MEKAKKPFLNKVIILLHFYLFDLLYYSKDFSSLPLNFFVRIFWNFEWWFLFIDSYTCFLYTFFSYFIPLLYCFYYKKFLNLYSFSLSFLNCIASLFSSSIFSFFHHFFWICLNFFLLWILFFLCFFVRFLSDFFLTY